MINIKHSSRIKPWWNRPIVGDVSLFDRFCCLLSSKTVPDLAVSLHNTEMEEIGKIAPTVNMLDNSRYSQNFIFYRKLKHKVENYLDEYRDIHQFVEILHFALHHIHDFHVVNRIELDYKGKSQYELYNFISQQLSINPDPILFINSVENEMKRVINLEMNHSIKEALEKYEKALLNIGKEEIGVNLLSMFKRYKSVKYTIFDILFNLLKELKKQDLQNKELINSVVETHFSELEEMANFIGIPKEMDYHDTLTKIIQYLALNHKYHSRNYRFGQLLENLTKWQKHYKCIIEVREQYPRYSYKLPEEFMQPIPAENIYLKYEDYLLMISQ